MDSYASDGLDRYYIRHRTEKGEDLESMILEWLQSPDARPIAVLGGYGSGKTTLARHITYSLGKQWLDGTKQRIPILIKLGDIAAEQSLEGLLGHALANTASIRNYSFPAFTQLNSLGQFVIILDAFDEMKHCLTWDKFKYNLAQLNRLVTPNAKVILIGRSTAFMSEEEQSFALHGTRIVGERTITEAGWPDYREVRIGSFTTEMVKEFLNKYLDWKLSADQRTSDYDTIQKSLKMKVSKLTGLQLSEIATRPVQLRMLAEVLPQWTQDIRKLHGASLYDYFVNFIIERECEKLQRQHFTTEQRRSFATTLAVMMWSTPGQIFIQANDIPDKVFQEYAKGDKDDLQGIKRDLVSACFLERNAINGLYFPHRSFQEFLIADWVRDQILNKRSNVTDLRLALTPEISDFVGELLDKGGKARWRESIRRVRGTIQALLLRPVMRTDEDYDSWVGNLKSSTDKWTVLCGSIVVALGRSSKANASSWVPGLLKLASDANQGSRYHDESGVLRQVLLAYCIWLCLPAVGDKSSPEVARAALQALESLLELGRHTQYPGVSAIFSSIGVDEKVANGKVLLDLTRASETARGYLRNYCMIDGFDESWMGAKIRKLNGPITAKHSDWVSLKSRGYFS